MVTKLYGNFGFINKPLITIPSNIFIPKNLFEKIITTNNLSIIGNNKDKISGGGISFDEDEAEILAFGEFVERYSSSFQMDNNLLYGSYNELKDLFDCFSPDGIKYFSENQYSNPQFKFTKLDNSEKIHWIKSVDYISKKSILMPFFMTNVENITGDKMFHINTTTGAACHLSIEKAIESGLMECIERDAFSKFWYLQKINNYRKFSSDFILKQYSNEERIQKLFNNSKVKIVSFDISEYSYCPTFVTIIYFKKKNHIYQTIGVASRLNHKEALIRSCIEAYQGIEYIETVCRENKFIHKEIENYDFKSIDSFSKHYALYNVYPNLIDEVPILKYAFDEHSYFTDWKDKYDHHITNVDHKELIKKGITDVYYTDLTTEDVKQFGLKVVKVTTPKLNLLTGNYNYPYLGLFEEELNLMLEFPHPFP